MNLPKMITIKECGNRTIKAVLRKPWENYDIILLFQDNTALGLTIYNDYEGVVREIDEFIYQNEELEDYLYSEYKDDQLIKLDITTQERINEFNSNKRKQIEREKVNRERKEYLKLKKKFESRKNEDMDCGNR